MPAFRLTKKAIDDLRSIARYTQKKTGAERSAINTFQSWMKVFIYWPKNPIWAKHAMRYGKVTVNIMSAGISFFIDMWLHASKLFGFCMSAWTWRVTYKPGQTGLIGAPSYHLFMPNDHNFISAWVGF